MTSESSRWLESFFRGDQKPGEDDKEYAKTLQLLAERAFRGCPPNVVKTNDLSLLVEVTTKKSDNAVPDIQQLATVSSTIPSSTHLFES